MGVNGLWKLLEPVGRSISMESLENKTLAVDVSLWLNQALYGMKNQHGSTIPNAHLVLLFQRICKLLYYRIKPIFVFDGGVPELKKKTLAVRRTMRLTAQTKAQKLSEKVLKKYLKSRAIGSVTGRKSQRSSINALDENVSEKDLFELPPLPDEIQATSAVQDESFLSSHHIQDTTDVNMDSEEFRSLPYEIQHEMIVEMHEKSKRHSRYEEIDMPEESDDFSNFQLNHLLKRGKLTQRLGTLRKVMNDKRAGELVYDVVDGDMNSKFVVESQKIMSEDTAQYILIKRNEAHQIKIVNNEETQMAGGFFPEDYVNSNMDVQPFVLKDVPKVSCGIDVVTVDSTADEEASDEVQDVPINANLTEAPKHSETTFEREIPQEFALNPLREACNSSYSETQSSYDITGRLKDVTRKDRNSESAVWKNEELICSNDKLNSKCADEKTDDTMNVCIAEETELKNIKNSSAVSPTFVSNESSINTSVENKAIRPAIASTEQNQTLIEEQVSSECERSFEAELDDLEEEINEKKRLIEKLLSCRNVSHIMHSSELKNDIIISKGALTCESGSIQPTSAVADVFINAENLDESPSVEGEDPGSVNEFEGKTYEELDEIQMRLDDDLENLKEERTRQSRLAATVTDEMYKDSQELLQLFGIPYVLSPMEAEAQCATLNKNDLCDGSITEDSDIILFGARKVYRNIFNQKRDAELYEEDDVKCMLGLDRLNLILIAMLAGSDYTEGVQGIGIVSAMEVINEFSGEGIVKLQNLKNWFYEKSSRSFQESKVKKKLRNAKLPLGFPSEQVFEAYLNPRVDDSKEAFSWANPDLHGLRLYASEKLGWSKVKTDEILLPVLKRLNSKEVDLKIDAFFPVQYKGARKIKSKRVKRVVNRLINKESEDDEHNTVKKRKIVKESTKIKTTQKQRLDNTSNVNELTFDERSTAMINVQKSCRKNASSDSTSDTSDEDHNYIPFNEKRGGVSSRSRGARGVRKTGNRQNTKKRFQHNS